MNLPAEKEKKRERNGGRLDPAGGPCRKLERGHGLRDRLRFRFSVSWIRYSVASSAVGRRGNFVFQAMYSGQSP